MDHGVHSDLRDFPPLPSDVGNLLNKYSLCFGFLAFSPGMGKHWEAEIGLLRNRSARILKQPAGVPGVVAELESAALEGP